MGEALNISEVYMLNDNLREFYRGMPEPYLNTLIGDHMWDLSEGKIAKRSFSYIPRQLSEWLFNWVIK